MAKFVLRDAVVTIDGNNVSDHASSVSIETPGDEVDLSVFGDTYREFGQGLKDATITVTFFQDFAAGSIDSILWPLNSTGNTFVVTVKASSAAVSPTNPLFTMTARLFGYSPIAGGVGEASTTDVSFRNAGSTGIVRTTS